MMDDDLMEAWNKMLLNCSYIVSSEGTYVSFPENIFKNFEQEFNIFFIPPEHDTAFQSWISPYKEGEENEG